MAPNNEISLSAVVAFGPRSLLATGTVAGSIDSNFATSSSLEVCVRGHSTETWLNFTYIHSPSGILQE